MTSFPDEDSKDLTAEEIEQAIVTTNVDALIASLRGQMCSTCQQEFADAAYKLLRRSPFYYSRMRMFCRHGHSNTLLFRIDWLGGSS